MVNEAEILDRDEGGQPEATVDVGSREQVVKAQKRAKLKQRELDSAFGAMLDNKGTRAWVWHLLEKILVFRSVFDHNGNVMCFNEGKRQIGLELMAEIHRINPDAYAQMAREANEKTDE